MLEEELTMAPFSLIGEAGIDSPRRREAIFFISQRVIILSNSDVHSFHKSEKMKGSTFQDFNIGGSNERGRCVSWRSFSSDWKNSCEPIECAPRRKYRSRCFSRFMDCFSFLLAPYPANSNIDCGKQLILGSHEKEGSLRIPFAFRSQT